MNKKQVGDGEYNMQMMLATPTMDPLELLRRGLECGVFDDAPSFKGDVEQVLKAHNGGY